MTAGPNQARPDETSSSPRPRRLPSGAVMLLLAATATLTGSGQLTGPDGSIADRQTPVGDDAGTYDPPAITDAAADRVLSGDETFPDGFSVPADEVWEFDPDVSTTVSTQANVVVEGVLRMRPTDTEVVHTLQFQGIDEQAFVGHGEEMQDDDGHDGHDGHEHAHDAASIPDSDVGLWVTGAGQLDLEGTERAGWNRTGDDPSWQPDDELRVAPQEPGDTDSFAEFSLGEEVPSVAHAGQEYVTEVMNLTRNVRIHGEGDGEADPADNGRAHIHITSSQPQSIRFAELGHMGPRQEGRDEPTQGVLGRYPLHFHMMGDAAQGSLVEGVVVRDSGNRAFVPHGSHGVTFVDTVAFNVFGAAYWWDTDDTGHGGPAFNATNDVLFERAMAAHIRSDPPFRGYVLSGFLLGEGQNMSVVDSVAVGVQGNNTASGFHWPASANGNEHNLWGFRGNVAHNNAVNGIFVWQNDGNDHLVEDFVGYHNGRFGVDHGAYANNYTYDGLVLFGNGEAGLRSKAASTGREQQWLNVDTDSILISDRALSGSTPIVFDGLTLRGSVVVDESGDGESGRANYEFRNSVTGDGVPLSADVFALRHQVSTITVDDNPVR